MLKRKTTMSGTLVRTFIIIIAIMIIIARLAFGYITKYVETEISMEDVKIEIANSTIEEKIEDIFGVVGTRMLFFISSSVLVGIALLVVTSKRIINPIHKISEATKEVSEGNFDIELSKVRNDEIGELTDYFNKMVKELKKVEYLQKDFISNVSHEFKTPMTAISGYVELLDDDNLSKEERKEYISIIKDELERLTNLSTNALRLSKLESQEEQQNKEEYSLDEQIRKCILLLEKIWKEKNIKFDLNLKQVNIYAEKELLEQVWINIISNAIKFSNKDGKVVITLNEMDNVIIVKIKDFGIGIDKDKVDRIFEKFYQADKSHSQQGSGLGLAITNRIVHLCNGEISVNSELTKGTEFVVKLPIEVQR